ncbi:hypothetical protein H3V53_24155 [Paraburkholderia bengalensis]|uniref:O-antigen ligase n=1 Tax=Paraburkholderia bengalensis TaxID=2747562 RepID=A0ABU8IXB2_9BURK
MRNQHASLWIWMFLFPLSLDYKASEDASSHLLQILLVVPVLGAGLILILIAPRFQGRSKMRAFVTCALALTIVGSVVTQLLQGNDFGNYLRVLLPFMLFVLGYKVANSPWHEQRVSQIEKALFWANVVCLIFTFVYGMATVGGVENVRYRIVSSTFLVLQGVLLHEFVITKHFTKFTVLLFAGTVVIELLSVTRSLLLGTALLLALATWMGASSMHSLIRSGLRAAVIGLICGGVVMAAASYIPGVAEHWTNRIFASKNTESGKDPTTITRLAEMKDQYDQIMSSTDALLFGKGYGHYYRYSPAYLPDLTGQISEKDFYAIHEWFAGHNFWVYQLFAGGIVFGLALPLALLFALIKCCMAYRRWRATAPDALYLPVMGRAILMVAALPATSIGGNPLGQRFAGLVFGVALGLMVSVYAQLQRAHPAPRPRRTMSMNAAAYTKLEPSA